MKRSLSVLMIFLVIYQIIPSKLFCQTLLTAQVQNVSGPYLEINRGSDNGLKEGFEGVVYFTERVWGRPEQVIVARIKVISVMPNTAKLQILESTDEIVDGYLADISIMPIPSLTGPEEKKGGSKWWIWLIIAAASGGVAAAVSSGGGGNGGSAPPPTTGTITYDIPAN